MIVAPKTAMDLYITFEKERDHVAAVALAFKLAALIPTLVQQVEKLEQSVSSTVRHVICKCEWCGNEYKVFFSEMKSGNKSGRFCSRACLRETQKSGTYTRSSEGGK